MFRFIRTDCVMSWIVRPGFAGNRVSDSCFGTTPSSLVRDVEFPRLQCGHFHPVPPAGDILDQIGLDRVDTSNHGAPLHLAVFVLDLSEVPRCRALDPPDTFHEDLHTRQERSTRGIYYPRIRGKSVRDWNPPPPVGIDACNWRSCPRVFACSVLVFSAFSSSRVTRSRAA